MVGKKISSSVDQFCQLFRSCWKSRKTLLLLMILKHLESSENIANLQVLITRGKVLMYITEMVPIGTLGEHRMWQHSNWRRNHLRQHAAYHPNHLCLDRSLWWHTESNALAKSRYIRLVSRPASSAIPISWKTWNICDTHDSLSGTHVGKDKSVHWCDRSVEWQQGVPGV